MVQSLIKAANILEFMKIQNKEYTIAEISNAIKIPPSTTHRILSTLIKCEFITKDDKSHLYKLGPGLISLGVAATANISLQAEAGPILKNLSINSGEDSFLIIKSGNTGLVIGKYEGPHSLKVVENFGREIVLHKGAIRKVILANQSDDYIEEYINSYAELEKLDIDKLKEDIENIRTNKIALSMAEYIDDAMGIGAPVYNHRGEFVASIGIVSPLSRGKLIKAKLIKDVKVAAKKLSNRLGYFDS